MLSEQIVADWLTCNGSAFICPQFCIPWDGDSGGSEPDFLVLDIEGHDLVIVEVSTAASINQLLKRVSERQTRWFTPIST